MQHHPGEVAVQRRAGAHVPTGWGSGTVSASIPAVAQEFLRHQRLIAVGAADEAGRVWGSVLTGDPHFVSAVDDRTIRTTHAPAALDPLGQLFDTERDIGLLAIEPSSRRRMRVNGRARRDGAGLLIRTEQVYANCPKYIQSRIIAEQAGDGSPMMMRRAQTLTSAQRDWIGTADTFFIATHVQGLGADMSHRGGNPGFVSVAGNTITWPDYVGNSMYMTLGNLELDPRAGLVFVDWDGGHTLHVTGRARIDWSQARAQAVPGAQRLVDFDVDEVIQINRTGALRWSFEKYSKFNPTKEER